MAITSIKTGSSFTNLTKYNDFLAGNAAYSPAAYESIATVTVGSGGVSNIDFTSIPSTYQHLQVRGIGRVSGGTTGGSFVIVRFNGVSTGNVYAYHLIGGDGSTVSVYGGGNTNEMVSERYPLNGDGSSSVFGTSIIDILDYKNTNKFKTLRSIGGFDTNSSGAIYMDSGLWRDTNAITSINLTMYLGNFVQYSKFGLFGIKGA
jgi:hypothetical protein